MSDNPFFSKSSFYDSIHFPHGFARSGHFTKKEADLLTESGYIIKQLAAGTLLPQNDAQKSMLAVLENMKPAETTIEKVWMKYVQLSTRKPTKYYALAGNVDQGGGDYSDQSAW